MRVIALWIDEADVAGTTQAGSNDSGQVPFVIVATDNTPASEA